MKSSGRLPHQAADKGSKEKRHRLAPLCSRRTERVEKPLTRQFGIPALCLQPGKGDGANDSSGRRDLDADDGRKAAGRPETAQLGNLGAEGRLHP